jgi:hypothetical protein
MLKIRFSLYILLKVGQYPYLFLVGEEIFFPNKKIYERRK